MPKKITFPPKLIVKKNKMLYHIVGFHKKGNFKMIGREKEVELLNEKYYSNTSSFIVIYGRRRVGKTYLLNETFENKTVFRHAGIYKGTQEEQLYSFAGSLFEYGYKRINLNNWFQAFDCLKELIKNSNSPKKVIFLDEIAWMYTKGSALIKALENFWNGWASSRKDVMLIICSSVTSWVINNINHSKGGLYNRITAQLYIEPFNLNECEEYSNYYGLSLTRKQIIEAYMVIGGVPYYWSFLRRGMSIPQFIDYCFFDKNAQLKNEFQYIFSSLFSKPKDYIKIIEALSAKKYGLTRREIIEQTSLIDNGNLTKKIEDLVSCGFVREYTPFEFKKTTIVYQLIDPFTIFHFHFITKKVNDDHFWSNQYGTPSINSWEGLSFERVCLLNLNNIKKTLGISGVYTAAYPWSTKKDDKKGVFGSQVDMIIERKDGITNLVEIKFASTPYTINSDYIESLEKKKHDFLVTTKTKSSIHLTFIALNGLVQNSYAKEIQSVISVDDLFA